MKVSSLKLSVPLNSSKCLRLIYVEIGGESEICELDLNFLVFVQLTEQVLWLEISMHDV